FCQRSRLRWATARSSGESRSRPSIGGVWPQAISSAPPTRRAAAVSATAIQRTALLISTPGRPAPMAWVLGARPEAMSAGPARYPAIRAAPTSQASACARRRPDRDDEQDRPRPEDRGRAASGRRRGRPDDRPRAPVRRERPARRLPAPYAASAFPRRHVVELTDHVKILEQVQALDHTIVLEQLQPGAQHRLVERGEIRAPVHRPQ